MRTKTPSFPSPKKYWGQSFLVDKNIIRKIIDSCELNESDVVLEIGPGRGALTEEIAKHAQKVIAVEKDRFLCEELSAKTKSGRVEIVHGDFLKFDITRLPRPLKVIGNLPYYISSPILNKLAQERAAIASAFVTVQLEFGQRMIAQPNTKDYSAFSLFIQYYADCKMLFKIRHTAFKPAPKVESCFLRLDMRQTPPCIANDEQLLFKIVHHAFQQRRKTIANSLSKLTNKDKLFEILEVLRIDPRWRAENLSLADYVNLANTLKSQL